MTNENALNPSEQNANPNAPPATPTQSPSSAPPPSSGRDYRYTAQDVAEGAASDWMVGKTPAEVARMSASLVQQASNPTRFDSNPSPQPQYTTPQHAQPSGPQPPDPQLMYSDPARYQQELFAFQGAMLQSQLQQVTAPIYAQNAQMALSSAKRGKYADVWKRFEPEVLGELQGINPAQYNEQLLEKAAEIVQGRHWREFVNEEAQRLAANGAGTERSSQAGMPAHSSSRDKLDEAWDSDHPYFVRAREQKLSKSDMRDFITKTLKQPVEEFVKNVTSNQVIATARGFERETR